VKLSASHKKVLHHLALRFPATVSPASIGAEVNGEGAKWAAPICAKLNEKKLIDRNELGHYRINDDGIAALRETMGDKD